MSKTKIKNWYSERYFISTIQRNFLFLLSIITSTSLVICLLTIKYLYENKSIEPFLIEYENRTGVISIVDSESKKKFTAQDVIKESLIVNYIKSRESFSFQDQERNRNFVRITTSKAGYEVAKREMKETKNESSSFSYNAESLIKIMSITHLSPRRSEIRIEKTTSAENKQSKKKYYQIIMSFDFLDIEMSLEDTYLNPLGFQVFTYIKTEEKSINN